jgi:UDP-N-acetylmuramoyl-tripeptide--D-alanyl-D-alanine ligase
MIERLYSTYLQSRTVTTDSRNITPGCIFFAFKGEKFDGNAFAPQALEQGAALCVVSNVECGMMNDERVIVVPDVLKTLQELAREHRRHLEIPVIGITGTNGKTTTKELVHAVLAKRYKTSATKGNFNNHLGVPLTLLAIPQDTEIAIVEMGANHPGEIEFLCSIADPDCGLITNVGRAHLEGFGSFEGVVQTKTELYRHLAGGDLSGANPPKGKHGLVFVNADNERLMHEAEKLATIPGLRSVIPAYAPDNPAFVPSTIEKTPLSMLTYGRSQEADVRGTLIGERSKVKGESYADAATGSDSHLSPLTSHLSPYLHFYFEVGDNVYNVHTHLLGDYNFDNCMAAVAVGLHFGVEPWDIKEAIEEYTPSNQRSEFKETARGNRLYLDCYNANPSSMEAAISSFATMIGVKGSEKTNVQNIAIIGGMHELGHDERKEHKHVVEQLAECHLDRVLLVGPEWYKIENSKLKAAKDEQKANEFAFSKPSCVDGVKIENSNFMLFPDTDSVRSWLQANPVSGATILIKGSNTNRLWTLEEIL